MPWGRDGSGLPSPLIHEPDLQDCLLDQRVPEVITQPVITPAGEAQSLCDEAILQMDLVKRNWIWQILPGLGVPPKSLRKRELAERQSRLTNLPVLLISVQNKGKSLGP